jgi:hypothetical protein
VEYDQKPDSHIEDHPATLLKIKISQHVQIYPADAGYIKQYPSRMLLSKGNSEKSLIYLDLKIYLRKSSASSEVTLLL